MNIKRHKLRLRKKVIKYIPVILLLLILSIVAIINGSKALASEITAKPVEASTPKKDNSYGKKLSDYINLNSFNETIEKRQKDNTVIYYANVFKLNIDKTLELAHKFTNDFEDEQFNKTFVIGPKKVKNKLGSFKNFEAGVVYFVRDLYRYPEKYGSSINEIRTSESPTLKTKAKDGNIYMDNGLTFEQYIGKISDLFEIDKSVVLAISYHEAGVKTSNLFVNKNNIGGHRGYGGWMSYTTLEAGVIAHVLSVKAIAEKNGVDSKEIDAREIAAISGVYVNGTATKPAPAWTEKVTYFENQINSKDLFTIKE